MICFLSSAFFWGLTDKKSNSSHFNFPDRKPAELQLELALKFVDLYIEINERKFKGVFGSQKNIFPWFSVKTYSRELKPVLYNAM